MPQPTRLLPPHFSTGGTGYIAELELVPLDVQADEGSVVDVHQAQGRKRAKSSKAAASRRSKKVGMHGWDASMCNRFPYADTVEQAGGPDGVGPIYTRQPANQGSVCS